MRSHLVLVFELEKWSSHSRSPTMIGAPLVTRLEDLLCPLNLPRMKQIALRLDWSGIKTSTSHMPLPKRELTMAKHSPLSSSGMGKAL